MFWDAIGFFEGDDGRRMCRISYLFRQIFFSGEASLPYRALSVYRWPPHITKPLDIS